MPAELDVELSHELPVLLAQGSRKWITKKVAPAVAKEAIAEAPVGEPDRLGRPRKDKPLRKTIKVQPTHDGADVVVDSPHFLPVHQGSRPHEIRPKRRGYPLRFYWDKVGGEFRTMKVNHPGNKPNPFLVRAARKVFGRMR